MPNPIAPGLALGRCLPDLIAAGARRFGCSAVTVETTSVATGAAVAVLSVVNLPITAGGQPARVAAIIGAVVAVVARFDPIVSYTVSADRFRAAGRAVVRCDQVPVITRLDTGLYPAISADGRGAVGGAIVLIVLISVIASLTFVKATIAARLQLALR